MLWQSDIRSHCLGFPLNVMAVVFLLILLMLCHAKKEDWSPRDTMRYVMPLVILLHWHGIKS